MGYGGLQANIKYAEEYTHAPHSKWDHPINAAVPPHQVVMVRALEWSCKHYFLSL